jgi:hypothetical protein
MCTHHIYRVGPYSTSRLVRLACNLASCSQMELPEIRLQIGGYLSIDDLASCVLVNKLWHGTFLPYLYFKCYTDVSIYHPQYWSSFKNNLQHTRNLNISYNTLKTSDDRKTVLQKCTLLRQLTIQCNINSG